MMTERSKKSQEEVVAKKRIKIGKLDLNKETVENLAEEQAEGVKGGAASSTQLACKCCSGVIRD